MKLGELLSHTERVGECFIWQRGKFTDGYGRIFVDGKTKRAHRLVMELMIGQPIQNGLVVCHTCDTPLCCNPDHLFLGTPRQNHHDAMHKGRHTRGTKVNTCKLSENQVLEILARWDAAPKKYRMQSILGREFNVSAANIKFIVEGKTWKHLRKSA